MASPARLKMDILHHPNLLQALAAFSNFSEFKQTHAHIITSGTHKNAFTNTRLLAFAAVSQMGNLDHAKTLFSHIQYPTFFMYNTMIRGFSQSFEPLQSVNIYIQMLRSGTWPDKFTFPFLLRSCSVSTRLDLGQELHCHVIKFGLDSDVYVVNNVINLYSCCREMGCARKVFEEWFELVDVVSWTALVTGYSNCGQLDMARWFFDQMPHRNAVSWNAMIGGYARVGEIDKAHKLFADMPYKNVASWSGMISGCSQSGLCKEAMLFFKKMVVAGVLPNEPALVSAISACAQLRALVEGEWVHEYIREHKHEVNVTLGTALVDMYGKCGSVAKALEVFREMPVKNLLSWNSMLNGLALNGSGKKALWLFWQMRKMGLAPNGVTFIAVLSACSHSGLVNEGVQFFDFMTRVCGVKPQLEHYGCMVDLLCRAGLIKEALKFVEGMEDDPHPGLLGAIVGACRIHGAVELGEEVGKQLIELEPHHSGRYVLLSNIYAAAERWDDVAMIRNLLKERRVLKTPGNSIVEA